MKYVTVHLMELDKENVYTSVRSERFPANMVPGHRPINPPPPVIIDLPSDYYEDITHKKLPG